ncbi:MAG: alpha/beta hydrolase, partial [Nitrosopumilus sp.]|nr:alpha/beta hydrolase [Nitrosopumilus sp.]
MKNSQFSFVLITSIIATSLGSSLLVSSIGSNLVYATTSLSQSIQQSQDELQSAINKEVQQTITDIIININNSNSAADQTNDSQIQNSASLPPFQQKAAIIDNMPSQKVRVGDIDIAYKQLGQGVNHIVLITGLGATMDMWSPDLLTKLSRNNTVIIFDNRGAGESTIGTKDFSISQFSNDTLGLLDALNIEKADILGWSMEAFTSQELASMHADRVNNLIFVCFKLWWAQCCT